MKNVAIIDYGMGNLRSVENAIKRLNYNSKIVDSPKDLDNFEKIILPGVGSFKKAMKLLATQSEEFGLSNGLNLIDGKIKFLGNLGCKYKIPQIGWNSISIKKNMNF